VPHSNHALTFEFPFGFTYPLSVAYVVPILVGECVVTVGLSGVGTLVTDTVTESDAEPDVFVHVIEKVVVEVRFETCLLPSATTVPFHCEFELEALQNVALVDVQERSIEPPEVTEVGLAVRFTVGTFTGCAPTVTVTVAESL
jgi:hypothetical protein